jgi:hypothetical protein
MLVNELFNSNSEPVIEGVLDNPGQEDSPVASAIIRRILLQRTDLLAKYGPERVGAAVDDVADSVGDWDEIGSSDVSGWVRRVEQMLGDMSESSLEEIDRRGFLKGVGAAAVAGAAGGANAEQLNIEPLMTSTDGSVSIVFVSRPGKAVNGWLALKKRNGQWSPQTNDPLGGIKIDGNKVITVGFVFVNTDPRPGKYEPDYSLANMNGIDYIHPIKTASKQILMNLKQIGGGVVEFNPRSTKESVEQGMAEGDIGQLEKDIAAAPVAPIANMEAQEKIGGRHDADDFDDMVLRLKKLAGSGPMKTVYDPNTRRYKNMPTAVQPPRQPKK